MTTRPGFVQIAFAPDGVGASAAPAPSGAPGGSPSSSTPSGASPSAPSAPPSAAPASATPAPSPSGAPSSSPGVGAAPSSPKQKLTGPDLSLFDGLGGETDDEGDFGFGIDPQVAASAVEGLVPSTTQAAVPPPAQPPVVQPEPAPTQPTASPTGQPGTQPAAASPLPTHAEPGRIAEQLMQNQAAIIDHLAQNQFQLSQEDAQALETDAVGFIPKLLARVFVQAQISAMRQMQQVVPAMTERISTLSKRNSENESKFYTRWPDIKADAHGEVVSRLARTYRQMNPTAGLDQMIEDLGPMVMMAAKIQPGMLAPQAPAAPAAPLAPVQTSRQPPSPFRPAGAGPGVPATAPAVNPWEGLGGLPYEDD